MYLRKCLSKAVFGKPTKSPSEIKLCSTKSLTKFNTYVMKILSDIFIRKVYWFPYPEGVKETFRKKNFRKVLETL